MEDTKDFMLYKLSKKMHLYWLAMNICVLGVLSIFSSAIVLAVLYMLTQTIVIEAMVFFVIITVLLGCVALFVYKKNSIVCKEIMYIVNDRTIGEDT